MFESFALLFFRHYFFDRNDAQRPIFLYSLLAQVCVELVALTAAGILLCLILFTYHYHIPLSRTNFIFQSGATTVYIIGSVVWLTVLFHFESHRADRWPYMFDYAEVVFPLPWWSSGKKIGYLLTEALDALCVHATHIQNLTLLFPSRLERRLILILLGPLALASCGCQFLHISSSDTTSDLGDAIRAVCNSSLVLLYTAALLIYSLAINRSRVWRMEGGTALFGALAIAIGVISSAFIFIEIKEDRMSWLQHIIWCVLLWQSWISFWMWVSAGMYASEVHDRDARQAQKQITRRRRKAKMRRKKAGTALPSVALAGSEVDTSFSRLSRFLRLDRGHTLPPSVRTNAGAPGSDTDDVMAPLSPTILPDGASQRHRSQRTRADAEEGIELADMDTTTAQAGFERTTTQSESSEGGTSTVTNLFQRIFLRSAVINRLLNSLSTAHNQAARTKALQLPTTHHHPGPTESDPAPESTFWRAQVRKIRLRESDRF